MRFRIRYSKRWERDLKRLGLYGPNFDTFWKPIEEFFGNSENPNEVGQPILDQSGARGWLTEEGAPDLPRLVIYFKADLTTERLVFLGLDDASLPDDYPPPEWG
jgi:hypothetical protein